MTLVLGQALKRSYERGGAPFRGLLMLLPVLMAFGCVNPLLSPREQASRYALEHGLQPVSFQTDSFLLSGFLKKTEVAEPLLHVYIEGDGLAWLDRQTLSADPSPKHPTALQLAVQDPAAQVLYLARPGQFSETTAAACSPRYWSSHRYSREVAQGIGAAIDQIKRETAAQSIAIVGYSGGGVIGALLAAFRDDVDWLLTVAANLDIEAWTDLHQVSPLPDSLNPADYTAALATIPQIHLVGGEDELVPESVIRSYRNGFQNPLFFQVWVVPEYSHRCCWVRNWPAWLDRAQTAFR